MGGAAGRGVLGSGVGVWLGGLASLGGEGLAHPELEFLVGLLVRKGIEGLRGLAVEPELQHLSISFHRYQ